MDTSGSKVDKLDKNITKLRVYIVGLYTVYSVSVVIASRAAAAAAVCAMQCNALITPDVADNAINDEETCISGRPGHYRLSERAGCRLYLRNHSRSCHYRHLLLLHAAVFVYNSVNKYTLNHCWDGQVSTQYKLIPLQTGF